MDPVNVTADAEQFTANVYLVDGEVTTLVDAGAMPGVVDESHEHVDEIVTSEAVGAHKPDPPPFEVAAERLPATERWLVGDDRTADVAGARDAGWRAVHVDGPASVPEAVQPL
jgi:FMN phosphatase YigB (HAD superfamily)